VSTIDALSDAADVLQRNPIIFAAGAVDALLLLPQMVLSLLGIPTLPFLVRLATVFITPFVLAGTIGMTYEGLSGSTNLGTFLDTGKGRYVSMLGGVLIQWAITIAFWLVMLIASGIAAVVVGLLGSKAQAAPDALAGLGALSPLEFALLAVWGLILLAYVTIAFLIQFFPPAIVIEDRGAIQSIKRSYAVVRTNLVPALGYSVIAFMITTVTLMSTAITLGAGPESLVSGTPTTGVTVIALVVAFFLYPFQQAFATAFFVRHVDVNDEEWNADYPLRSMS
jgi:hypothetical protein